MLLYNDSSKKKKRNAKLFLDMLLYDLDTCIPLKLIWGGTLLSQKCLGVYFACYYDLETRFKKKNIFNYGFSKNKFQKAYYLIKIAVR